MVWECTLFYIARMTGSLFSDAKRSVAMAPMILMPLFVFGGQFSNLSTLPAWISWFQYISVNIFHLRSALQVLSRNSSQFLVQWNNLLGNVLRINNSNFPIEGTGNGIWPE
jgi:hypothetical protein